MNRILIVDDERSIHFALSQYFARLGFAVDSALTADDAMLLLNNHRYAVAILDVELRDDTHQGGLDVANFIKKNAPSTSVLILSALETPEVRERAAAAGVRSCLPKPSRLSHIAEVALNLIGS